MALRTGQLVMTGSAVQLTNEELEVDQVLLRSPESNNGSVYMGAAGVTTSTGFLVTEPGEVFRIDNDNRAGEVVYFVRPKDLYFVGDSGDVITWLAWVR